MALLAPEVEKQALEAAQELASIDGEFDLLDFNERLGISHQRAYDTLGDLVNGGSVVVVTDMTRYRITSEGRTTLENLKDNSSQYQPQIIVNQFIGDTRGGGVVGSASGGNIAVGRDATATQNRVTSGKKPGFWAWLRDHIWAPLVVGAALIVIGLLIGKWLGNN